ncbi:NAD(+) synthase [Mycoplasmopsis lipofaciens]|uniref:NAD(+) synthase n=1 Tax=Mycoplasmopsis lipofaciens TaxID=114884 RepID=UPI00047F79E5|nr:NAD(+) synthase [Mycoplasmopsis lipofaciens]
MNQKIVKNSLFKDNKMIIKYIKYLVEWLKEKVKNANCNGLIFGISGGIDSAVVAALCKKAFPNNSLGVIMPIDNMEHDINDINQLVNNLKLNTKNIDLKNSFVALTNELKDIDDRLAISNIKPRLRMTTLYALGQQKKYLVVGTDNAAEYFIGYFTKYGDGGVDLLPISHLLKCEVKEMAKYLNIPESIINKKPSAGLWEGQNDEDELGITYYEIDNYIMGNYDLITPENKEKMIKLHKFSQHKRDKAYQPKKINEI